MAYETLSGYIDHIIYQNEENGYTVFSLICDGTDKTCTGHLPGIAEGESIEVNATCTQHPVYGKQWKISEFRILAPADAAAMERYLASGAIKGIGAAFAAKIVQYFGADTFRIMEEEPERLAELKGISEKKARDIAVQMQGKRELRAAVVFLQNYGIGNTLAMKIFDKYGAALYGIVRENPYRLAEDVAGVGFIIADQIARKAGISVDSEYRIRCGLFHVLTQAAAEGHTCLPKGELINQAAQLLEVAPEHTEMQLSNLAMDKKITVRKQGDAHFVYDARLFHAEMACARLLLDISEGIGPMDNETWDNKGKKIEAILYAQDMEEDEQQLRAIKESVRRGVVIISGGPGTGKTSIINSIIQFFIEEKKDILLAAPTGRAAKRMQEMTGYEAKTIHRLLEVKIAGSGETGHDGGPDGHRLRFERNAENPLEADVIIIDEMSMVDCNLFFALLKAISPGTRLILVGDMDQLPSVGPGQVLKDIIDSAAFSTVFLTKIYRQAKESDIVQNAHRINRGLALTLDNKSRDFFFLERQDVNVIYKHMIQLITEKLPAYVEAGPLDIQVLTPMRKGPLGAVALNQILQEKLNPASAKKNEYQSGDTIYREGDKVMQIKNNYDLGWEVVAKNGIVVDAGQGIYNGDLGIIREINARFNTVRVEYDEQRMVTYEARQLNEVEMAYAITIHKAQGSEYPAVVLPLLKGPAPLMNRNILYTGVTRARRLVIILGEEKTVATMIDNAAQGRRHTGLKERIHELHSCHCGPSA